MLRNYGDWWCNKSDRIIVGGFERIVKFRSW